MPKQQLSFLVVVHDFSAVPPGSGKQPHRREWRYETLAEANTAAREIRRGGNGDLTVDVMPEAPTPPVRRYKTRFAEFWGWPEQRRSPPAR